MTNLQASSRVYTRKLLSVYDIGVHGLSNRFIWHCPTQRIIDFYNAHITSNHLDIGVATGFLLDRSTFPTSNPRITLVDINPNCLDQAKQRLIRYHPTTVIGDVLQPLPLSGQSYTSIGLGYLLHCLPGTIQDKGSIFDDLRPLLDEQGVIFGTTVLGAGLRHPRLTRRLLEFYNRIGAFSNLQDDASGLEKTLASAFSRYTLEVIGSVALFAGHL